MRLVDVHCHLEDPVFEANRDAVIEDARRAGIVKLITASVVPGDFEKSRAIAGRYPEVEFAMGIHPWYADDDSERAMPEVARARAMGAIAIGEIGLDRKIERPDFDLQRAVFEMQLEIARELRLPVIMHCRGAFNDILQSFKRVGPPNAGGIVHSFSGSAEIADRFIDYGIAFSMGGVLTYRNSRKRAAVLKRIYPDHFMLETDSPDIPPVERRGVPNVPANIAFNLTAAAELLSVDEEVIAETTSRTAARFFGISLG